jgi:hypothetical protein
MMVARNEKIYGASAELRWSDECPERDRSRNVDAARLQDREQVDEEHCRSHRAQRNRSRQHANNKRG